MYECLVEVFPARFDKRTSAITLTPCREVTNADKEKFVFRNTDRSGHINPASGRINIADRDIMLTRWEDLLNGEIAVRIHRNRMTKDL